MGMTMTQKILAQATENKTVKAGDFIYANLDMVLGNDITTPVAIKEMTKCNCDKVFSKTKISLVPDHFTPNKDINAAEQCKMVRNFAYKHDIENYFEVGEVGIEHALLPEKGLVIAGDVIIGADSHTCTYGALGAFSTGVGSTDMAAGMMTGKCWFKVPSAIKINLTNKPNKFVTGKDVILYLIGKISVSGARYKSLEFTGEGLQYLSMDDRFTIANMAIEAGAKNGIFDVDNQTLEYIKNHSTRTPKIFKADDDAEYDEVIDIDLSNVPLTVSCPHSPDNTKDANQLSDIKIDQVVIGSCTNGRYSDLVAASEVFKNNKVAKGIRAIIIPATQHIYKKAMNNGLFNIFIDAGCIISPPTCGPCLGGHMGILASDEVCVATTNRNFIGRMGHTSSKIYLASPYVAASSAILGRIATPEEVK